MTRQEAIMKLEMLIDLSQQNELKNMHEALRMAIRSLETVRGEWAEEVSDGVLYTHCSECGSAPLLNIWNKQEELSRYCPNCGAEMKEKA